MMVMMMKNMRNILANVNFINHRGPFPATAQQRNKDDNSARERKNTWLRANHISSGNAFRLIEEQIEEFSFLPLRMQSSIFIKSVRNIQPHTQTHTHTSWFVHFE